MTIDPEYNTSAYVEQIIRAAKNDEPDLVRGLLIEFGGKVFRSAQAKLADEVINRLKSRRPAPGSFAHMFPDAEIEDIIAEQDAGLERQKRAAGV